MVRFAQFGAGRIGKVHASNMAAADASLAYVVDVNEEAAQALAAEHGARVATLEVALADESVDAVLIAAATSTHVDLIVAAAAAKKAIFCEKPIDLDLRRADEAIAAVEAAGVPFFVGFNRRFDRHFGALKGRIAEVGRVEMVAITSRDPSPPPMDYVKVSGGLFRDMMIHDFDMARWLLPEEPLYVSAAGSCLVDEAIGRAGDVDSAMVILETGSGVLCQISNSRRATYGYDQRIEVHGSDGMLRAGNPLESTIEGANGDGVNRDKLPYFFLERYREAYQAELTYFVQRVRSGAALAGAEDGRRALCLAEAAFRAMESGRRQTLEM